MADAKVAFYIAKNGNLVDKLIAWYTRSEYSHVELIIDSEWYSTSPRDLRVRKKFLLPKEGHWDFFEIDIDKNFVLDFYDITKDRKYDWLGIFLSQFLPMNIHSRKRYFCSEWCASAMMIPNSNKYSPEGLYQYVKDRYGNG